MPDFKPLRSSGKRSDEIYCPFSLQLQLELLQAHAEQVLQVKERRA